MLAIAAQINSEQIGTGFLKETRPERLFTECSNLCEGVSQPAQMLTRIAAGGLSVLSRDVMHLPAAGASAPTVGYTMPLHLPDAGYE